MYAISEPAFNRIKELLLKGLVRFVILTLLEKREMTGYNILKELRRIIGIELHAGTVYPLLYELEESGLLNSFLSERGRRRLRYYRLTEAGRELLEKVKQIVRRVLNESAESESRFKAASSNTREVLCH